MKTFHCTHCQNLVFFENVRCLNCGHSLAFLPDLGFMGALSERPDGLWRAELDAADSRGYRLCANYDQVSVCNWVVPADDSGAFCGSCRLNRVIPDLSSERNRVAWFRLEVAKRRLLYTLLGLWLPIEPKAAGADSGLAFEFLEDSADGDAARVLTGHDNGLITINIAEADDVHREKQRTLQKEPYRTLLGHFRGRRCGARAHRARQWAHHHQYRRSGRCAPGKTTHAPERAVPHAFGAFPQTAMRRACSPGTTMGSSPSISPKRTMCTGKNNARSRKSRTARFWGISADGDAARVLTGHDNGLITINIAEADDVHREKQRTLQKEPYRTLLGHFRRRRCGARAHRARQWAHHHQYRRSGRCAPGKTTHAPERAVPHAFGAFP